MGREQTRLGYIGLPMRSARGEGRCQRHRCSRRGWGCQRRKRSSRSNRGPRTRRAKPGGEDRLCRGANRQRALDEDAGRGGRLIPPTTWKDRRVGEITSQLPVTQKQSGQSIYTRCRLLAQVDFRREMCPKAFVDPGAFVVANPARSPRTRLLDKRRWQPLVRVAVQGPGESHDELRGQVTSGLLVARQVGKNPLLRGKFEWPIQASVWH